MSGPTEQDMALIRAQVWQHTAASKTVLSDTAEAKAEAEAIMGSKDAPEIVKAVARSVLEQVGEASMPDGEMHEIDTQQGSVTRPYRAGRRRAEPRSR